MWSAREALVTVGPLPFITKTLPPRPRDDVLRRGRLLEFLHDHINRKLLLVVGPAGYGKTTLISDFARDVADSIPICWYTIEPSDRDPRVFLEYLVASISRVYPDFGIQTLRAISSSSDLSRELHSIVGTLTHEIRENIHDLFAIAFDDFQQLDDSREVNAAVDLLLQQLPDNCRLIVASRTIPHLTLSRLAAAREVAGIGTSDLRFEADEIQELFSTKLMVPLEDGQAEALTLLTEGWITGILLTSNTLSNGVFGSIVGAGESSERVYDYITQEVLLREPQEIQDFLLDTALLRRLNPEQCNAFTSRRDAGTLLEHLERSNLFISRLEGPGDWYRCHQLFREFLLDKLRREQNERLKALGNRAADQAFARGEPEEAISYLLEVGEYERSSGLIEQMGERMITGGRSQTIAEWIDALPESLLASQPRLLLHRAQVWRQTGNLERSCSMCTEALDHAEALGDDELIARVLLARAFALRLKGLYPDAIADVRGAMALIPESNIRLQAEAHQHLGTCYGMKGEIATAIDEMERARSLAEISNDPATLSAALQGLARALNANGRLPEAAKYYERARKLAELRGDIERLGVILLNLGIIHYLRGEFGQASESFERARFRAQQASSQHTEAYVEISQADVLRDQGQLEEALNAYERGMLLARQIEEPDLIAYCLDATGRAYRLLGRPELAEKMTRQALRLAEEREAHSERAVYLATLATLQCEAGHPKAALRSLHEAKLVLENSGARRELPRVHLFSAQAHLKLRQREAAISELATVDEMCRDLGYDAFLWTEATLLKSVFELGASQAFGLRFGNALRKAPPSRLTSDNHVRTLVIRDFESSRELHVRALGLISVHLDGKLLSSPETAGQLPSQLLFLLLTNPQGLRREQVAEALWADRGNVPSGAQVYAAVHRLRSMLWPNVIRLKNERYCFDGGDAFRFDVSEFEALADAIETLEAGTADHLDHCQRAMNLYRGPFFPECDSEWCEQPRRRLEMRMLTVASALSQALIQVNDFRAALTICNRMLQADPFEEKIHEQMLRCYAALGNHVMGSLHYQRHVHRMEAELGEKPSASLQKLYLNLFEAETMAARLSSA